MAYHDLRDFIATLERAGELRRVTAPVSPELEITEITDRVCKANGPALLFGNVPGYQMPVLTNAFGSFRRMAMALGVDSVEEVAEEIRGLLRQQPPTSLGGKVRAGFQLLSLSRYLPKTVSSGPCQEVAKTEGFSLRELPVLKCWPQDGGPFITLPMVITKCPDTGVRNVGMYRMQLFDDTTTGMHWHVHKVGARHYRRHTQLGTRMPVAVALGGDPAITYAATAPLPEDVDEMLLAGFLRKSPVELVKCETIPLEVPADAEIVLEGYVEPGETRREGPFGDHTGYYSLEDDYPVFHVTCMTRRREPIYPATIVGRPPMEDCYMGKATERIFLPLLQMTFPEIVDLNLPLEGVFHNLALISIRKRFPGHAQKVMHGLWGMGQMMFTKVLVICDEGVNVQDTSEVVWKVLNNIDPQRDVTFVQGPVDVLDHAAPQPTVGTKMGIDATRKWPEEGIRRPWPDEITMTEDVKRRIDEIWSSLGLT
ncbi:MAG: menaquinone biosynthesis decarboxylase [Armatimonadetes bacterium]|nr:menaquinone biosynthesis decarboxylase [Armatimonadota bacterium]